MAKIYTPHECLKIIEKDKNAKNWNAKTKLSYLETICYGCDYTIKRKGGMIEFKVSTYNDIMALDGHKDEDELVHELKERVHIAIICATKMNCVYKSDDWSYPSLTAMIEVDSTVEE